MVRRERPRKTAACWAVDMRPRRLQKGISTEQMADRLRCADAKHVCSIETRYCSITMEKAIRGAYTLEALIVELEGVGGAIVVPFDLETLSKPALRSDNMRPGEAAWILRAEIEEALEVLGDIQTAVTAGDAAWLSRIVEQASCDVAHSARLLAEAAERMNPTITADAAIRHSVKLMRKGILTRTSQPLDAA